MISTHCPGSTAHFKVSARAKFADAFEARARRLRVRCANCKTVAGRAIKGRIVAIGKDRRGQDAAKRLLDFNCVRGIGRGMAPATSITFCRASV